MRWTLAAEWLRTLEEVVGAVVQLLKVLPVMNPQQQKGVLHALHREVYSNVLSRTERMDLL